MSRTGAVLLAAGLCGLASGAAAGGLEATAQVGRALPFYEQAFALDPAGLLPASFPTQARGGFSLVGRGDLALAGGIAWYPLDVLGLEVRVDSATLQVPVEGGSLDSEGLPVLRVSAQVDGSLDVSRLTVVSADLKLRSRGRLGAYVSAGLSYLPRTTLEATARVEFSVEVLPGVPILTAPAAGLGARAELEPGLGANLGAGLRLGLAGSLGLVAEGRVFAFPERELRWGPASGRPSALETELARRLAPIRFRPGFFQVTAGISIGS